MVNKYSLGLAVLGIFLLAILGIGSASNWLSRNSADVPRDSVLSIDNVGAEGRSQSNRVVSQASGSTSTNSADLAVSPLEEAGTYIQRQKRVEQDPIIANTPVDVISNTVAAQSNTAVNPQPPATTTTTNTTTPSSSSQSATAQPSTSMPSSPAVPALW